MKNIEVGFVLCSSASQPIPSTRIASINMLPFLLSSGFHGNILFEPLSPTETPDLVGVAERAFNAACRVVVLQKVSGPSSIALVRKLRAAGVRTIFSVCDRIDVQMAEETDATIIVTEYLKSLYPKKLQKKIHVVHDGIEKPEFFKIDWTGHHGACVKSLKAVLVTSASLDRLPAMRTLPSELNIHIVGQYQKGMRRMRERYWQFSEKSAAERVDFLKFLLNSNIKCVPWGAESVYNEMLHADVGIIPIDTDVSQSDATYSPLWMKKSENRLTLKMSIGLPVVATPIPAYEPIIEHGVNGFFAVLFHFVWVKFDQFTQPQPQDIVSPKFS